MSKNNTNCLLRIKINDFNFLQLKLINNKDFIFSIPKTNVASQQLNTHFTLHTQNDVVTWKTTSFVKNGKDLMSDMLKKVELSDFKHLSVPGKKELNMLYGKKFDFTDSKLLVNPHANISLNLINSSMSQLFVNKSKTSDVSFDKVVNFSVPADKTGITIKSFIGKNFSSKISAYIERCDDYCEISHQNHKGDQYSFLFLVKYEFPEVQSSPSSIVM